MNDDILTLYYYRDGLTANERRDVERALREDDGVARRYDALKATLDQITIDDSEAAPPHLASRWHDSIERAARSEQARPRQRTGVFHLPSFFWGTAITAALVVGVGIGVLLPDAEQPMNGVPEITAQPAPGTSAAFMRGLQVHLRDSRHDLVNLSTASDTERALLILQIIQQNRLFERAAEQNDAADLARVLRAFEPILMRLAADDVSPEDAEALRAKLAFELNVMLTKLARDESEEAHSI